MGEIQFPEPKRESALGISSALGSQHYQITQESLVLNSTRCKQKENISHLSQNVNHIRSIVRRNGSSYGYLAVES